MRNARCGIRARRSELASRIDARCEIPDQDGEIDTASKEFIDIAARYNTDAIRIRILKELSQESSSGR
jgi:hypothetical protein